MIQTDLPQTGAIKPKTNKTAISSGRSKINASKSKCSSKISSGGKSKTSASKNKRSSRISASKSNVAKSRRSSTTSKDEASGNIKNRTRTDNSYPIKGISRVGEQKAEIINIMTIDMTGTPIDPAAGHLSGNYTTATLTRVPTKETGVLHVAFTGSHINHFEVGITGIGSTDNSCQTRIGIETIGWRNTGSSA